MKQNLFEKIQEIQHEIFYIECRIAGAAIENTTIFALFPQKIS